jgi:hypothetical protein
VANDLTDAIKIALERVDGDDERGLETFEFAGPTSYFAIVGCPGKEVALLKRLIAVLVDVSAEPVDFHGLCRRIRESGKLAPTAHIVEHRVFRVETCAALALRRQERRGQGGDRVVREMTTKDTARSLECNRS